MLPLPNARLVDARPEPDYEAAHLPRAVSLTPHSVNVDAEQELPGFTSPVAVYGAGASDGHAALVADKLRALGYESVFLLPFGFSEWQDAGGVAASGPARWEIRGCGG